MLNYINGILILLFTFGLSYLYWLKHKVDKQKQQIQQIKAEAKILAKELDNANKAKTIQETHRTLSDEHINKRMHEQGYYRD